MSVRAASQDDSNGARIRHLEAQLAEERKRFADVVEHAPDGLLLVDAAGLIVQANAQVLKMFGYTREELVGRNVEMLVPDGVRPRHPELRASYMADPHPRAMGDVKDIHGRDKNGVEFPIALGLTPLRYGNQLQVMATILDLTPQRYAQEALRESEARLRQAVASLREREEHLTNLVRSIPDAVLTVNEAGVVEEVNPAAGDMFRTDPASLVGRPILELFPPAVAKAINVDGRVTEGVDFLKGSVMAVDAVRGDGTDFRATVSVNRFKTAAGVRLLWILRDVSVELRYEKERQSLNRALAEKNRELESIIYAASHDLRSPLVNLQGFSRELQKSASAIADILRQVELPPHVNEQLAAELMDRIPEALGFIDAGSRKMDQLIRGLLRLSRLGREELRIKVVDMNRLAQEVVQSFEYTIREKNVRLEVGDLPPCVGDSALLNQVLSNLLDNALKYLDASRPGVIRITGRVRNRDSEYVIEDNGIGIPPKLHAKVFEVFHRLNPNSPVPGEGLGLSIVRRILDRHNGNIRAETTDGHGVKFVFTVPAPRPADFELHTKKVHHAGT